MNQDILLSAKSWQECFFRTCIMQRYNRHTLQIVNSIECVTQQIYSNVNSSSFTICLMTNPVVVVLSKRTFPRIYHRPSLWGRDITLRHPWHALTSSGHHEGCNMPWRQTGTRPSTASFMTRLWLQCYINHGTHCTYCLIAINSLSPGRLQWNFV